MPVTELDFDNLRSLGGSLNASFQQLINQLARDTMIEDQRFCVKGPGADGGVECYLTNENGEETGWQAKYVENWSKAGPQFTKSLKTSLETHANLKTFIVCVPFDLSDGRQKGERKSSQDKYDDWASKQINLASKDNRIIDIVFWGKDEITTRLFSGSKSEARLRYFFDATVLSKDMLRRSFRRTVSALGRRYVPANHVTLPVEQAISALRRSSEWRENISGEIDNLSELCSAFVKSSSNHSSPEAIDRTVTVVSELNATWNNWLQDRQREVPLNSMRELLDKLLLLSDTSHLNPPGEYHLPDTDALAKNTQLRLSGSGLSPVALDKLSRFQQATWQFIRAFELPSVKLSNANSLLVTGDGGIGKSHLLADSVQAHLESDCPGIMVLGGRLPDGQTPWRGIIQILDEPSIDATRTFLGCLDTAAATMGERALVCIDAINEGHGISIWPAHLADMLEIARDFPNVALVLSCRTIALSSIIPELPVSGFEEVKHVGFAGTGGRATQLYIENRGLRISPIVKPVEEFNNPLLLSLVCDSLEDEGETEFPANLDHLSNLLTFALNSICKKVEKDLSLDANLEIPKTSLQEFATLSMTKHGQVDYSLAHAHFEKHVPSAGKTSESLLLALIGVGVLSQDVMVRNKQPFNTVRFTFERMGDFISARELVKSGLENRGIVKNSTLESILCDNEYVSGGICEALALVLADYHKLELPDLNPEIISLNQWRNAFVASLRQRRSKNITSHTMAVTRNVLQNDEIFAVAVSRASFDGNLLNSIWLDGKLRKLNMITRDLSWSVLLLNDDSALSHEIKVLLEWVESVDCSAIDADIALKLCLALSWCLTASHRETRDRATKALVRLIASDVSIGVALLSGFANVDDLYVAERLYAAIYGAILQGNDSTGVSVVADTVYDLIFSKNAPPNNLLLRDHAKCILMYARTIDPSYGQNNAFDFNGPYQNQGLLTYVPSDCTPGSQMTSDDFRDTIESSVLYGDFGIKILRPFMAKWSPVSLTVQLLPTNEGVYNDWKQQFLASCTDKMKSAFENLITFADNQKKTDRMGFERNNTPWTTQLATFESIIGRESFLEFEKNAQRYIEHYRHHDTVRRSPASIGEHWGQRWVWQRVHEMGWTADAFYELERGLGGGRYEHRRERIGKKYQWLALYELGARLQDGHAYIGHRWGTDTLSPASFPNLVDLYDFRNTDPSLLRRSTYYHGWRQWPETWWVPKSLELPALSPRGQLEWIRNEENRIVGEDLIDVIDPADGSEWLVLSGFVMVSHKHDDPNNGLDTWSRTGCFVVPLDQRQTVINALKDEILTSPNEPVSAYIPHWSYIGEIEWQIDCAKAGIEYKPHNYPNIEEIRATTVEYSRETSGYDHSLTDNIKVEIPAPWLANLCKVRLSDGARLTFEDSEGITIFRDPSSDAPGPSSCLVRREVFFDSLKSEGLFPIWIQAGEKRADLNDSYAGCRRFTRLYISNSGTWDMLETIDDEWPTKEQLLKFLGPTDIPEDHEITAWSRDKSDEEQDEEISNLRAKLTLAQKLGDGA